MLFQKGLCLLSGSNLIEKDLTMVVSRLCMPVSESFKVRKLKRG